MTIVSLSFTAINPGPISRRQKWRHRLIRQFGQWFNVSRRKYWAGGNFSSQGDFRRLRPRMRSGTEQMGQKVSGNDAHLTTLITRAFRCGPQKRLPVARKTLSDSTVVPTQLQQHSFLVRQPGRGGGGGKTKRCSLLFDSHRQNNLL